MFVAPKRKRKHRKGPRPGPGGAVLSREEAAFEDVVPRGTRADGGETGSVLCNWVGAQGLGCEVGRAARDPPVSPRPVWALSVLWAGAPELEADMGTALE